MRFFNYHPSIDKSPKGAVKINDEIEILCKIEKTNFPKEIVFFMRDDNNNTIINNNMIFLNEDENYKFFKINFKIEKLGIYFYHFIIKYENYNLSVGHKNYTPCCDTFDEWQLTIYDKSFETPNSFKGSIMYQIFPDRFNRAEINIQKAKNEDERIIRNDWGGVPNSNYDTNNYSAKDFFMGNLKGIKEKKNYLKDLNINTLYLNPIFESAENHRYSTADYFKIDPYLGTNDDFKVLVNDFKKENISIILDGVFSHTGSDSIYFNRKNRYNSLGAYQSRESQYYSWFSFYNYPNKYHSWWGFDNLPTVNKDNQDFSEFINGENGVLSFWDNYGISGWRLDVADEFPSHFLERLRTSVKSRNKENIIIGEVWENASNKISYGERRRYLLGKQLDTVMNYPWRNAILNFVRSKNTDDFKYEIENILETYPKESVDCLMNMLSTHDTCRALLELAIDVNNIHGANRITYKLNEEEYRYAKQKFLTASFIQFTLPGVPCIYYGDEIGMYGFSDPFNRKSFEWDKIDYDILNYIKSLSKFRKDNKLEFLKDFKFLSSKNFCISYKIGKFLIIVNLNDKATYISELTDKETDGVILFGEGEFICTKLGSIVSSNAKIILKLKEEDNE